MLTVVFLSTHNTSDFLILLKTLSVPVKIVCGTDACVIIYSEFICIISGGNAALSQLLASALERLLQAYRFSTGQVHRPHCRTYLPFLCFFDIPFTFSAPLVITFLHLGPVSQSLLKIKVTLNSRIS